MVSNVAKSVIFALLWISASQASHVEGTKNGSDLTNIVVEGNGLYSGDISSDEPRASCSDFQLHEKDVREFFASASPLTQREYSHDLSGSNCYASGYFIDGHEKKSWRIDRARRGLLIDSNRQAKYFYCNSCLSDLYYEPCDIECEHSH